MMLLPNRFPSTTACSKAESARGLPSRPTSRRVNTATAAPRRTRARATGTAAPRPSSAGSPPARFLALVRIEPLGDHHVLRAAPPQRHAAPLAHRALQRIEGVGGEARVLGDRVHGPRYVTEIRPTEPATTRPITAATGVPSRPSAATSASTRAGGTAINSPPDVCASASSTRVVPSTPAPNVTPAS